MTSIGESTVTNNGMMKVWNEQEAGTGVTMQGL